MEHLVAAGGVTRERWGLYSAKELQPRDQGDWTISLSYL